jgi:predicted PurR-regulated permease PerM
MFVIAMTIFGMPYAFLVGVLIAFTALIPIVGAFIGCIVGAFLILMDSPVKALIFLIFIIILQQIEGNLIYPKVVGTSIGLPGLWVLAAVTVGGGVMGVGGMLLGVPLAAALYKMLKNNLHKRERAIDEGVVSDAGKDKSDISTD